ncbi:hypothetical protein EDC01DRAFT_68404 [Geopyxis carbonaria]|nr:hypothetical protein EDC01DRAFT_68404 [Geopyxis carbonaria]
MHTPPPSNDIAYPDTTASGFRLGTPPLEAQDSTYHSDATASDDISHPHHNEHLPVLPTELWADIFEFVGDWEVAYAFGVRCSLRVPPECTDLDRALMTGHVPYISSYLRKSSDKITIHAAKALIRFGYVDVLRLLHERRPEDLQKLFRDDSMHIPVLASRFGKTKVLQWWWFEASLPDNAHPLRRDYNEEPLDEASRKGYIHCLQWWKDSSLPLKYGLVMDVASSSGQLPVLEWWKNSGLQLTYGRNALRAASYRGEVGVLEWWKRSGLRLIYDKEVLVEATKFNRVEVLEWWKNSELRVEYLLMEIEAALEDAIGGGKEAREWWRQRGARFNVPVRELMEYKVL